ncbi:MAG TPA: hypothetical protein EYG92_11065 [Lutibacter sp.]|nr:hypothetical protein [Lutibacter sp.]
MRKLVTHITRILTIGFLFGSVNLLAQDLLQPTDERTYQEYMDKVLEPLVQNDASLLKNGILYDRVFPMADLVHFNNPDSLNKSNFKHFTRSLSELYGASITPQTDVLSLENMGHVAYHFERQGKIQIGIINVDFSIIDSLALKPENPKLEIVNQRLTRIADKNPYLHKKALVISPIAKEGIYGENTVFEFGKIFIQKTDNPIKDLIAIFENNQSFTIFQNGNLVNESITVNFSKRRYARNGI